MWPQELIIVWRKNGGNERDITVDVVLASPKASPDPSTDPCDSVSKVIGRAQ